MLPAQTQTLPAKAAEELLRRRRSRANLLDFICYTKPGYLIGRQHRAIADAMERVERGELDRVMIFCPPRHGKSEIVSRKFPAWYLGRNPDRQIISASYAQELSDGFGRDVRNLVASDEYARVFPATKLAADSKAVGRWHTNSGGTYLSAGVGSGITGRGADVLSIDDPLKDRKEAESQTIRDTVWNWYTSTAYTRLMPGGSVVVTLTRWHQDDLAGRLLEEAQNGGDQWHIVDLPAIDAAGEALWPERYDIDALNRIRAAIGERDWSALYQQSPRPLEGSIFKVAQIGTIDGEPNSGRAVRAWDLAATAATGGRDPDWTVGVKLLKTGEGAFVVADVVRIRGAPEDVEATILATASRDGRSVEISIPQDPGQAGVQQVLYFTRKLQGYNVHSSTEGKDDKATRAMPVASQANVGNLKVVRAAWNRAFLDELGGFPGASKDDQVDALSRAFSRLVAPSITKVQRLGY